MTRSRWNFLVVLVVIAVACSACGDDSSRLSTTDAAPDPATPQPQHERPDDTTTNTADDTDSDQADTSTVVSDDNGEAIPPTIDETSATVAEEPQALVQESASGGEDALVQESASGGEDALVQESASGGEDALVQESASGGEDGPAAEEPHNLAPSAMEIGAQYVASGTAVGVDLSLLFSDPDGDELLYEAASSDTSVVAVLVSGAELELVAGEVGVATVSVEARDPGGLSSGQSLEVTVRPRESAESDLAPGHPDPARCRPHGVSGITAGFPLPDSALPAAGRLRVAVLFVDFPDFQADHTTQQEAALGLSYAEEYLESSSYGQLDVEYVALHQWLRTEDDHTSYLSGRYEFFDMISTSIDKEAARLAEPHLDLAQYDMMMVVMPSSHFVGGNVGGWIDTSTGPIPTMRINASVRPSIEPVIGWGPNSAHELLHSIGLLDLYPYEDTYHDWPQLPDGQTYVFVEFGSMGLAGAIVADSEDPSLSYTRHNPDGTSSIHYSIVVRAHEMLAWSRWQLGWLDDSQVRCVSASDTTLTLTPAAAVGDGEVMAAIPLSDAQLIVIESRRRVGYDQSNEELDLEGTRATLPGVLAEGVIVYTVDASLGSGDLPLVLANDRLDDRFPIFVDYPVLTVGQSLVVRGYQITVLNSGLDGDTVRIRRGVTDVDP